ncbi:CHAT domain-containing protein [Gordonia malaquae]|uniref:CHAT domain-containing protein n=1 Tax=Gordonia malaquae TaxID=410332 RepID=UPI003015B9A6
MPTTSAVLIAEIEDAFAAGFNANRAVYAVPQTAHQLGKARYDAAVGLTYRECSFSDAVTASRLYGEAAGVSKANNLGEEDDCEARLAMLLAWVVVPNRDEARLRASELMYRLGEKFLSMGEQNLGAMQLTNGALAISEMNNPTPEQQKLALETLQHALRLRPRGSADFAYGLTNLAVMESQIAGGLPISERSSAYKSTLKKLNMARRIFTKNNEKAPRSAFHDTVLGNLESWLSHEISLTKEDLYSKAVPDDQDIDLLGLSKSQFVSAAVSNFAAVGLRSLPEWIPSNEEIVTTAISRVPMLKDCIERAERYLAASESPHPQLHLKLYSLRRTANLDSEFPYDSMDALWSTRQMEKYLVWAIKCMNWQDTSDPQSDSRYRALIRRSTECVLHLKSTWSTNDIERLLQRNPLSFRFLACELARMTEWRDAFILLESSRGLTSSRTLNDDACEFTSIRDSTTWVHVTNSPTGSFAVYLRDGVFGGREFDSLSGSTLAAMFSGMINGLLPSQISGASSTAASSAEEIAKAIAPIGDWIYSVSGRDIVIMPGGYYQSFPVWTAGMLGSAVPSGERTVYVCPSRMLAYKNARERDQDNPSSPSIQIEEASSVAGYDTLPWSFHEPRSISSIVGSGTPVTTTSATRESLAESLSNDSITHFTGHSHAKPDPYDSALVTYGDPTTVRDLLGMRIRNRLTILGSCQSGLAMNYMRQDEHLSIQSAIFYAGGELCIGTAWPVRDYVAFAFSVKLYSSMISRRVLTSEWKARSVLNSFADVIRWMRSVTCEELNCLLAEHQVDRINGAPSENAFRFYDWAAFGVVGTSI